MPPGVGRSARPTPTGSSRITSSSLNTRRRCSVMPTSIRYGTLRDRHVVGVRPSRCCRWGAPAGTPRRARRRRSRAFTRNTIGIVSTEVSTPDTIWRSGVGGVLGWRTRRCSAPSPAATSAAGRLGRRGGGGRLRGGRGGARCRRTARAARRRRRRGADATPARARRRAARRRSGGGAGTAVNLLVRPRPLGIAPGGSRRSSGLRSSSSRWAVSG